MFEVEVHKKKTNRACRNVAARWTMTLVSKCDFALMIARMGFAHGRSIACHDMHGVRPKKRQMDDVGCITPVVQRNRVVGAASE